MNSSALHRALLVGGTVLLVLAPLAAGAWYVAGKQAWAQDRLAQLEPRYARLLGVQAQKDELKLAGERATRTWAQYVYPAVQDDAQTGNQAQQKVRDIFSAAGLQILSSQVLLAKEDRGFDRIALVVRTEGDLLAVQSALAVLGSQQPAIVINELDIQVQGNIATLDVKRTPRLLTAFTLGILRERT